MAAAEVAKWIAQGKNEQLEGKVLTWDLGSLSMEDHVLIKCPQCQACGEKAG